MRSTWRHAGEMAKSTLGTRWRFWRVETLPLVLSRLAMRALEIFFFRMASGELPRDDRLRLRLRFFEDVFVFQEIINARSHVLFAHRSSSSRRFRANAKSSSGVVRVFS
jgi:hypothetical protein